MSADIASLVSDNLDIWTSAVARKSGAGRGGAKLNFYGIDRLRALILDLAVRGKLVAQDAADEPASAVLLRVAKDRRRKIDDGAARKPKKIAPLPEDLPSLPSGWVWTQLGTIAEISPNNAADEGAPASFVPMALVSTSISGVHDTETRNWGEIKRGFTHFAEGDLGLAKITPCFENGKAAIFQNLENGIGAGTTELHVARPWSDELNRRYLLLTMKTASYLANGEEQMTGTAGQKRVTRAYFESNPLPLPPLAEQERIVAKVDELMALCDALEAQSVSALEAHQTLVEALLATLVNIENDVDLFNNWVRLEACFDALFIGESSIGQLKKVMLELAVRGRLTPQNDQDEPAKELLRRISAASEAGGKRRRMAASPISAKDVPFAIPRGWVWARFGQLATVRSELVQSVDFPNEIQIAPDIVEKGTGKLLQIRTVEEAGVRGPNSRFHKGQIIYSKIRPSLSKAVIADFDGLCSADMYPVEAHIDENFLLWTILSEPFLRQVRIAENRIKMPKLNQDSLNAFMIAVPPLAEQQRIVVKINELMALCEALDAGNLAVTETQKNLADTIVERAAA